MIQKNIIHIRFICLFFIFFFCLNLFFLVHAATTWHLKAASIQSINQYWISPPTEPGLIRITQRRRNHFYIVPMQQDILLHVQNVNACMCMNKTQYARGAGEILHRVIMCWQDDWKSICIFL